ncbi:MAG TPA: ATP-binding protein, partial [Thermoanaerobaculia bacterium]|nr:ATP-binding protein [Thermoanaerobaculia bacterium]
MPMDAATYEKLGAFYLGRRRDAAGKPSEEPLLYDSQDLLTHALCVGMTGSGKTGLCLSLLEEAAIDGVPALVIDPKGDLANLMLTFPNLAPADFAPWVDPDRAAREGITVDQLAAKEAETWKNGLAKWGENGDRIARLKQAADFRIYTPGSSAGWPVSMLSTFTAPPAEVLEDDELLRDHIGTLVGSLLGLLGIDADPVKSREHILISTILDQTWRNGKEIDIAGLVPQIQKPSFDMIGALPIESFYPGKERFELAMAVNNLLAAPGFSAWREGDPLDVGRLLYTESGKPRVAILSIAHLGDAERMSFVALLLSQTVAWMRTRPGTSSLRALVYMDEIFGFFPPVAVPPSKKPLLTLLKQARAFGVGIVLATQNPVDLDYRGLANIGTWFLGRMQTDQDKQRILDGLEGAVGSGFDRGHFDKLLSGLEKRNFLLHDVHQGAPEVFETRWAMSYLRGPLTRQEIKRLMDPMKQAEGAAAGSNGGKAPVSHPGAGLPSVASMAPVLPDGVPVAFLPVRGKPEGIAYRPALLGFAQIHYSDAKRGAESTEEVRLLTPFAAQAPWVDWYAGKDISVGADELEHEAVSGASFASLPGDAAKAKSYAAWEKDLADCLFRTRQVNLWQSALGLTSKPGESERDFRIRLADLGRERRDAEKAKLQEKYGTQLARIQEQIRRATEKKEREAAQSHGQWLQTGLSV